MISTDQVEETDQNESPSITEESGFTRRDFLQRSMAVASGVVIGSLLPSYATDALTSLPQACTDPAPPQGQTLQTIMEIKSAGPSTGPKTLQGVLKILDEKRTYYGNIAGSKPPKATIECGQMRYISGYDMNNPSNVWPKTKGFPSPGPTLRASVGDTVQITLVNNVNTSNFPGNQLDVAEKGTTDTACAEVDSGTTYPGKPTWETLPNCFHGSSSTNLHFHGTHISPSGIADNILINLRPSPRKGTGSSSTPIITEQTVAAMFKEIFAQCATQSPWPLQWSQWPTDWQNFQKDELVKYDNTATWRGQSPPAPGGGPVLPLHNQLWWQNTQLITANELPQYYIGAYPYCFTLPKWNGQSTSMGQAPGTHWYHAHKHGSTAINLANGMAGALIIEGDYDAGLQTYYQSKGVNIKANEKVLLLQQISVSVGLLRAQGTKDFVWVNGQYQPVLEMKPNETQFWRIINACHQQAVPLDKPSGTNIRWVQTAQDGVQLDPQNYNPETDPKSQFNTFPNPPQAFQVNGTGPWFSTGSLAPGNRIDLLVQAPSTPGNYPVTFGGVLLFTVKVGGTAVTAVPFPTPDEFPEMPKFLWDIVPPVGMNTRNIRFNTTKTQLPGPSPTPTPQGTTGGRNPTPSPSATPPALWPNAPPTHTINGKQFSGHIDQNMTLGTTEAWNLFNDTPTGGPAHPFHIHVNPFQIVRWFDPANMPLSFQSTGVPMRSPWVWWDNFAIPVQGWVQMWTRFVDFTGTYVFHCHILGHEDRGMMQLVRVNPAITPMSHE
ncbi:MAG TPA: multicopper oxidase domain-containing protein [Pyrinomonadaceae bacterium]|nr:multicopper oxidase domain-containing protein [Pyrinomonadaceae bacterium]